MMEIEMNVASLKMRTDINMSFLTEQIAHHICVLFHVHHLY